ncbi:MAG: hypothetical protein WBP29_04870 [Candidatus Zixiibacteriota bacterium]
MRLLSPALGAAATADLRLLIAGVFMLTCFAVTKFDCNWRQSWKQYLIIGPVER